jgi:cytochrome c-type biogenesis protein
MILRLFTWLSGALQADPSIALLAALVWGIASVILSPCHLASIPLIIGFISQQGTITVKRAFSIALLFATGILITIALIGIITSLMGKMLGDIGPFGNYFVALIFFAVGLFLLGVIKMPSWLSVKQPNLKTKGFWGSFILGLVFGVALGPCTFAYMMPVLGVAFAVSAKNFLYASLLVIAYAVGHCTVIVAAGTSTQIVQRFLNWNEKSKGVDIVKKICGILVILGGVYLIVTAEPF